MSFTFTKLFSSITSSTVWMEPAGTRLVWIAMLANCDRKGRVFAALPGLAHLARVTLPEAEAAIATFLAPDPYSRTADFEGRRIADIDGGWQLLNHEKYRAIRDEETVRESKREHMRRKREGDESGKSTSTKSKVDRGGAKQKQKQSQKSPPIAPPAGGASPADDSRGTRKRGTSRTFVAWMESLAEGEMAVPADDPVFDYAKEASLPRQYVKLCWFVFRDHHKDRHDKRYIDWRAAFRNYVRMNYFKLWRSTSDGGYELTSVGEQNMRQMKGQQNG